MATIPIKTDGSKEPSLFRWKHYEKRLPTEGELQKWFGNGKRPGIALIGGKVSGNLEVLDFDAPELIAEWRDLVEGAAPGLLEQLPQVETPSGGLHVFYQWLDSHACPVTSKRSRQSKARRCSEAMPGFTKRLIWWSDA